MSSKILRVFIHFLASCIEALKMLMHYMGTPMLSHFALIGKFVIANVTGNSFWFLTIPMIFPGAWCHDNGLTVFTLECDIGVIDLMMCIKIPDDMEHHIR